MATSASKVSQPPLRVAVDTGGTFTDCVWMERGRLRMTKVFSTPGDPSQAIAEALAAIDVSAGIVLLHGTTVGTNTLLQRTGAKVAFVTTAGFEDTIEIGRQNRPKLYNLTFQRVPPLVERGMRFGIAERVDSNGSLLQRPSPEDLRVLARDVHASGAEAIAVSTLFSFANAQNERAIGRVLEELGLPLSLSHIILPEFREYERASTVVVNAYLQPVMQTLSAPSGRAPAPRLGEDQITSVRHAVERRDHVSGVGGATTGEDGAFRSGGRSGGSRCRGPAQRIRARDYF